MGCSSGAVRRNAGASVTVRVRVRQGLRALALASQPYPLPEPFAASLPAAVRDAWDALAPYDQRHLIAVARELAAGGRAEQVVAAGLLHDIGKAGRVTVGARVVLVLAAPLGEARRNRLIDRVARLPGPAGLHLLRHHAASGADLLARSGLPAQTVWLVRHHEGALDHPDLRALQAADRRN